MLPALWTARLRVALFAAVAFLIPWPFLYSAWALVFVAILTVFTAHWPTLLKRFAACKALWVPVAFFALYALSYFWSEHKDTAAWAIESKLAFVLLPIVLGAGESVDDSGLRIILRASVAGVAAVGIYCVVQAFGGWQQTGDASYFFYHKLVTGFESHATGLEANAVYMALYACFALLILVSGLALGPARSWRLGLTWLVALPLAVFFVLLSSRTLLVLFAGVLLPAFWWHRRTSRRGAGWLLVAVILIAGSVAALLYFDNPVRKRFADVARPDLHEAFLPGYQNHDQKFDNLTTRLFIWRVGIETVRTEKLWLTGAGAGDVHYLTDARMDALGIRNIYNEKARSYFHGVNMHNMYLQALLAVGLAGLLLLMMMVTQPLLHSVGGTEGLFWRLLFLTFTLFMLQEAALQTQAGIIPFALALSLFWNRYQRVKKSVEGVSVKPV